MIVTVEEGEYARLLGYPWGMELEGEVRERAEQAAHWYEEHGNPRVYRVPTVAAVYDRRYSSFQQTILCEAGKPTVIDRRYSGDVYTVAALTAGGEVDEKVEELWELGLVDEAYFLDRYAAGVVETLARSLGTYRSPGTGGMPLDEQFNLFAHIAPLNPEIQILPSGMLKPKNSLLALITDDARRHDNVCTSCDMPGCTFRRRSA